MNLAQMSYQRVATTEAYFQGRWESSAINSTISGILGAGFDESGPPEAMANPIDGVVGGISILRSFARDDYFKQQTVPNSVNFETIKSYNLQSNNEFESYLKSSN
jgi:hypothetical protein